MKINYPVKYAAMPIYEQVGWCPGFNELEREYGTVCYIVSKCYLVKDSIRYRENGQSIMEYEVVFPYQHRENRWERKTPSFNIYSHECTNSDIVEKVFDTYEEALEDATTKNDDLLKKIWGVIPYTKDFMQVIAKKSDEFDYKLARYKMLEQQILYHTSDIDQSNVKELGRLISIRDNRVDVSPFNLYDFFNFSSSDKFIVYSISNEQYDKLRELSGEDSISNVTTIIGPATAILYHESKESIIRLINLNKDGASYIDEYGILDCSNQMKEVTQEELNNEDEATYHLYTTETVEDVLTSYRKHEDIHLSEIQGPLKKLVRK